MNQKQRSKLPTDGSAETIVFNPFKQSVMTIGPSKAFALKLQSDGLLASEWTQETFSDMNPATNQWEGMQSTSFTFAVNEDGNHLNSPDWLVQFSVSAKKYAFPYIIRRYNPQLQLVEQWFAGEGMNEADSLQCVSVVQHGIAGNICYIKSVVAKRELYFSSEKGLHKATFTV
jgi:hypothetical protein